MKRILIYGHMGDTNEQRVRNYCMYNYDGVLRMFMRKKK